MPDRVAWEFLKQLTRILPSGHSISNRSSQCPLSSGPGSQKKRGLSQFRL